MILIECPNCGPRNALEFRYGGEYNPRPSQPAETPDDVWTDYVYMRANKSGLSEGMVVSSRRLPVVVSGRATHYDQ